jgi:hypothetical protein
MSEGNIKTRLLDDVHVLNGTICRLSGWRAEWRYSQAKLDDFVAAKAEISISKTPFRPKLRQPLWRREEDRQSAIPSNQRDSH